MLSSTMKYGAVRAKVLAMYAKLLSEDDWRRLCRCGSVQEMTAYLRGQSGWGKTFLDIPSASTLAVYNSAVRQRVFNEYSKLYSFSSVRDKRLLLFTLHRFEYEYILSELRRLSSGQFSLLLPEPTGFLTEHSGLDLSALRSSGNYSEFLDALEGSIFHDPLAALPLENDGLPKYSTAAIACEHVYYAESFKCMKRSVALGKRNVLTELTGAEADLVNIVSLLRLLRSFHSSLDGAPMLLIPVRFRLTPEIVRQAIEKNSEADAVDYLRTTPCSKYLESYDPKRLDSMADNAMAAFCRKLIRSPEPDVFVPKAYLFLLEMEARKLTKLLEAANYGIDPSFVI